MSRGHKIDWTPEMDATVAGMKRAGLRQRMIAERLGLPVTAIQDRARKLGAYAKLDHKQGPAAQRRETSWKSNFTIEESDEVLLKGA